MGEFDLIERLAGILGEPPPGVRVGIGDDAALLEPDLVVTTDLLVEGVHFRRETTGAVDLGWKALAVSVSDLAAMGATPIAAVIGLALGGCWAEAEVEEVYRGVRACADAYGCPVVGGDVSRSPVLTLAVTVFGRAATPALRSGARPGDVLAVTGSLGGSEAGRLLLEGLGVAVGAAGVALRARHRRPSPRLAEGLVLSPLVSAMLDVSDGVASDARRLALASGVRIEVDLDALPLQAGVAAAARAVGREPGAFAATGGEDYELLASISQTALTAATVPLTRIGRVVAGEPGVWFVGAGATPDLAGWDHLRER